MKCQKCDGHCLPGTMYATFSTSPRDCFTALLCEREHVSPIDRPKLDDNFRPEPGEIDMFLIHKKHCCYGSHCRFKADAGGTTESYNICGWDGTFCLMPVHERTELDPTSGEETIHCINACPDDYNGPGLVTWMEFQKVASSEEKGNIDDEDYGVNNVVKFQTE